MNGSALPLRLSVFLKRPGPWTACLCFLLFWLVYWCPVVAGQCVLFIRDITFYALPMKDYWLARVLAGELPLWTPYLSTGLPFLADPSNQTFYPLNILFIVVSGLLHYGLMQTLSVFILCHHLFAMAAFYALMRALGVNGWPAIGAGLLYGVSGYCVSVLENINYMPVVVWAPAALAAFFTGLKQPTLWPKGLFYSAWLALSLSMLVFAGDLMNAPLLVVYLALFLGLMQWKRSVFSGFKPVYGWMLLGVAVLLCAMVCWVQVSATAEILPYSIRQSPLSYEEATRWSFPPQRLIEFIQPFFYGSHYPAPHFIGVFLYPDFKAPWADSVYLGAIPLWFAWQAFRQKSKTALLWGVMGVVSLLLAFGQHMFYYPDLFRLLPPMQFHRYPEKHIFWTLFSLCVLAGLGLNTLLSQKNTLLERFQKSSLSKRLLGALTWLLGSQLLLVWLPAYLWILPYAPFRSEEWGLHFYERLPHVWGLSLHWFIISALLSIPFCLSKAIQQRQAMAALFCIAILDTTAVHFHHMPVAPASLFNVSSPAMALTAMKADMAKTTPVRPQRLRFNYDEFASGMEPADAPVILKAIQNAYHLDSPPDKYPYNALYRVLYSHQRLLFNHTLLAGGYYLNGSFMPLRPKLQEQMETLLWETKPDLLLTLSSTPYVVTTDHPKNPRWEGPGFTTLLSDAAMNLRVVKRTQTLPRAYLAQNPIYNPDPVNYYKILTSQFKDPLSQVEVAAPESLDDMHLGWLPSKPYQLAITTDRPEKINLAVSSPYPRAFVVITESWFPGWQAWLDGREVPVLLANHRFLSAPVGPGQHRLDFTYHSAPLERAWPVSVIGLLLCLVFVALPALPLTALVRKPILGEG